MALAVALNASGEARGELFWDDGESLGVLECGNFTSITFLARSVSAGGGAATRTGKGSGLGPLAPHPAPCSVCWARTPWGISWSTWPARGPACS